MKTNGKKFIVWLLGFLLLACNQKPKEEQATVTTATRPDTADRKQTEITVNPYASVDISPMDMSYFPVDYPKLKMAHPAMAPPLVRVIYSRPHLQRRALFNGILKYDEPWRLGANESSEIDFYKAVTIQGKRIPPGRYVIYGIPHHDKWTIVLNSNIDSWGLKQEPAKDIGRFEIPISTNAISLEYFTMVFEKTETGADLVIAWADVVARLPIKFS
jgi:hypothetical protein